MNPNLNNKVILITGSGSGIGKTTALECCKNGATVIINGRTEEKLIRVQKEFNALGYTIDYCAADITNYEDCNKLTEQIIKRYGKIDVVVANASVSMNGRFEDTDPLFYKQVVDSNIYSIVMPLFSLLPYLKKSEGSFIMISSIAGIFGVPTGSAYCTGKMALTALHQSLSAELSIYNIHLGIMYVGFTENDAEKKTYAPDGSLIPVPKRNKLLIQPKEKVALSILKMIKYRKRKTVLTAPGKLIYFIARFMPSLLSLISKNHERHNLPLNENIRFEEIIKI